MATPLAHVQRAARVKVMMSGAATHPGGRGAVREVCDPITKARGTYEPALAPYFG